jgi:CRP-like cAMP-binding protein
LSPWITGRRSLANRKSSEINKLFRKFTVTVGSNCELISLSIFDLEKILFEFPDVYLDLHEDAKT